jgi:hypothetical protein
MPSQYPGNRGVRPPEVCRSDHGDRASARLFVCVGCRASAVICSCCDRGQIYCAGECARRARRGTQRAAGRRYQTSRRGRLAHAVRERRYRAHRKNVTHQGSPPPARDDLLVPGSLTIASDVTTSGEQPRRSAWHCHWCGRRCPDLVRQEFLRRRGRGLPRHDPNRRRPW